MEVRSRCKTFRGFSSNPKNHQLLLAVKLGLRESPGCEKVGKPLWKPHLGTNCHSWLSG